MRAAKRSKVNLAVGTFNVEHGEVDGMTDPRSSDVRPVVSWKGVPTLTLAAVLAVGTIACGGGPDVEPEAAVDTLDLLDRELDLAMSGDSAPAELRDVPQGEHDPADRSGRSPEPRPSPKPAVPASPPEDQPSGQREDTPPRADAAETEPADEAPASGPRVAVRSVAGGATFEVRLNQELSTRHNRIGDLFSATLLDDLTDGRLVLVPAGALIVGEVTAVEESGSHGKTAIINLAIQEVSFDGESYPIAASILEANPETRSRSSTASKAAKIGGAAAAGAILGRVIGGDALGTIIGTAVGGAAGTAIVLGTDDVDAVLPRGSRMLLRLDAPLQMRVALP